jgi:hypothetical protein
LWCCIDREDLKFGCYKRKSNFFMLHVGGSSMATGPRGRSGGGYRTGGSGGVWAERWAAAPPVGVVEEAGWVGSAVGASSGRD